MQRNEIYLQKKIELEFNHNSYISLGDEAISTSIFKMFKRLKSIGQTNTVKLHTSFWSAFQDCERRAFGKGPEWGINPEALERPFAELEKYFDLATKLGWTEESRHVICKMKELLHKQCSTLLEGLMWWNLPSFCTEVGCNTEILEFPAKCSACSYSNGKFPEYDPKCRRIVEVSDRGYGVCNNRMHVFWPEVWTTPKTTWENLSPRDWITILESISLVWNNSWFIEDFGPEKIKLDAALCWFRNSFDNYGMPYVQKNHPGDDSIDELESFFLLELYKTRIRSGGEDALTKVKMPKSLSHPSHWGNLAWKYIKFCNERKDLVNGLASGPN